MSVAVRLLLGVWAGAAAGLVLVTFAPRALGGPPPLAAFTDCAVPCFLGIIPGQTTAAAAERILAGHDAIYITYRSADRGTLMWHYRSPVPPYFDAEESSRLDYNTATGRVREITLQVRAPLWQVAASVPLLPTQSVIVAERRGYLLVSNHRRGVATWTPPLAACPHSPAEVWATPAQVIRLFPMSEARQARTPAAREAYWWDCR